MNPKNYGVNKFFFRFLSLGLILFLHFSIYTVTEITGITETKLDNTVYDSEVFNRQMWNDRNGKGGGIVCYIRSNICYSRKTCLSDNLGNIFIDYLFPETKPVSVGIFYEPPSQTPVLKQVIMEFEFLVTK